MSYLKNSYNLCVFDVPSEFKMAVYDIHKKMSENYFVELTPSQEFGHGWCDIKDIFKVDFTAEQVTVGDCAFGGYRYDKKTVPQSLVKKLFKEKLRDRRSLGEKLSKEDKKQLKEECRVQLILKAMPIPSMVTWIWDLENSKVYLDSKSTKLVESFSNLFCSSFGVENFYSHTFEIEDQMDEFLQWIWKNLNNRDDLRVDDDIILDTGEKTLFKFNGPSLENYLSEIESIKNSKSFKKLNATIRVASEDYKVGFSSKSTIFSVKLKQKIKHDSSETAVLDNLDRIRQIISKLQTLINEFLGDDV